MSLYEYAWSRIFEITQRKPHELKLILSQRLEYPLLRYNGKQYVIILAKPRRLKNGSYSIYGAVFPESEKGALLRLFNASIHHLAVHTVASDYSLYREWSKGKDRRLAEFTSTLIEDAAVDAYIKAYWPGVQPITAYANAVSYAMLNRVDGDAQPELHALKAILSYILVGRVGGETSDKATRGAEQIASKLRGFKDLVYDRCIKSMNDASKVRLQTSETAEERLKVAEDIWGTVSNYPSMAAAPSLPYTENLGGCSVSRRAFAFDVEENGRLKAAYEALGLNYVEEEALKDRADFTDEAIRVFEAQESYEERSYKSLKHYTKLGKGLRFKSYSIPMEDYSEYMQVRRHNSGSIRRILEELKKVKQASDESYNEESGTVDIQSAVQVIASESMRNDVFKREELLEKSEAWAILIDSSLSLRFLVEDVKSIATCLAEVAKDLITAPDSWGLFSFDSRFQLIKDFHEPYSNRSRAKIGGLRSEGVTLMPDAIELAARALAKTSQDVKLLLTVTDGSPVGYEGIDEDLVETIEKVRRSNIIPLMIILGSRDVKKLVKTSFTVDSSYDLMKRLVKIYLELHAVM